MSKRYWNNPWSDARDVELMALLDKGAELDELLAISTKAENE